MITFTGLDLIQIGLLLAACWGCYRAGINQGVNDALIYLESEGIIKLENTEDDE